MANYEGQQFGDYRLIRFLGRGTFGDVYQGKHIQNNTLAAVKVLHTRLTNSDDLKQFINEARTFRLKHPHIVQLLDFGIGDQDIPFLIMDYAPNGDLGQRHPRGTHVPLAVIVSYVKQIASALQYAHDRKLIHRDVKPANILLGSKNEILVTDFGIAVVAHSTRSLETHDQAGTVLYMAPEQIQGKSRPASDQYALGIIVYEWLCGEPPFRGSAIEIAMQHALAPPPSLREKAPGVTSDIEQVVMTALAKEPRQRFSNVQAFATALENAVASLAATTFYIYPGHSSTIKDISWSPDGSRIASASDDGTMQVWSASTGSNVWTYHGHIQWGQAIAWSPDITRIASTKANIVQLWDAFTGRKILAYCGHAAQVEAIAWSPDGTHIASTSMNVELDLGIPWGERDLTTTVHVWDALTGRDVLDYRPHFLGTRIVAWAPDGKRIACVSDDVIEIWSATTGDHILTYRNHKHRGQSTRVGAVAWSPDGTRIASADDDGGFQGPNPSVQIWDATTGKHFVTYQGHLATVNAIVWSPCSKYIFSASADYTVQVWDATTGSCIFTYTGHSGRVTALALSPDGGRVASGNGDYTQIGRHDETGEVFYFSGYPDWVNAVRSSPNGRRIPSSSSQHTDNTDNVIHVWVAPQLKESSY